jgi:hypothetical protein
VFDLRRLGEAEGLLEQARDQFAELGSAVGLSSTHIWLSRRRWKSDDHSRAATEARRALDLTTDVPVFEAAALVALGDAETGRGRYQQTEEHLHRATTRIGKGAFRWHRAQAHSTWARLHTGRGDSPGRPSPHSAPAPRPLKAATGRPNSQR